MVFITTDNLSVEQEGFPTRTNGIERSFTFEFMESNVSYALSPSAAGRPQRASAAGRPQRIK